jgi:hypothetical protein
MLSGSPAMAYHVWADHSIHDQTWAEVGPTACSLGFSGFGTAGALMCVWLCSAAPTSRDQEDAACACTYYSVTAFEKLVRGQEVRGGPNTVHLI